MAHHMDMELFYSASSLVSPLHDIVLVDARVVTMVQVVVRDERAHGLSDGISGCLCCVCCDPST